MPTVPARTASLSSRNAIVKRIREFHLYLGTFFAPAILFFAFTGALQTFSLHESRPGSDYSPPMWIQRLAQIHKKQTATVMFKGRAPEREAVKLPQGGEIRPDQRPPQGARPPLKTSLALKWFVCIMSLGLMTTTALGICMAFLYNRDRRVVWSLLIAGTVLPVLLLLV